MIPARPAITPRRALRHVLRLAERLVPDGVLVERGPADRRRLALTFDDGPHALSSAYLDVLDRFAARATFFVVGEECERRPDVLVDVVRRGHELGHHGYHHRRLPRLGHRALVDELARTAALLPPPRTPVPLLRPPRGDVSLGSLWRSALAGYCTVLWSLDSEDWRTSDADEVVARLDPARARPGDIVLLHEGQPWTLAALPRVLGALRDAGFELVTVGELLAGDTWRAIPRSHGGRA